MTMLPACGVYLMALLSRLAMACDRRVASPRTVSGCGGSSGEHRVYANGLRNPVSLAWQPDSRALNRSSRSGYKVIFVNTIWRVSAPRAQAP